MKIIYLVLILFFYLQVQTYSQFRVSAGIGFQPTDYQKFSDIDKSILLSSKIPLQIVDFYPSTPVYEFGMSYKIKNIEVGFIYSKISTGSRLDYADYSGEYKIDNILSYKQYGISFNYSWNRRNLTVNNAYPEIYVEIGSANVVYSSRESVRLYSTSQDTTQTISGSNIYIRPGISFSYKLSNFIFSLTMNYNFSINDNIIDDAHYLRIGTKFSYILPI